MNLTQTYLWTAIVTPMNEKGEIDYTSFETLLKRQESAGNGNLILGSTGEGLALTDKEKREVVAFSDSLNLKTPLMVGVGGFNLPETLSFLEYCEGFKNVSSYLMPTPLYAKPGVQGQIAWFDALMSKVNKPCMLYNVPSRTGVKFHLDAAKELKNHQNFWALKEASGSLDDFRAYTQTLPNVAIYSGEDAMLPTMAPYNVKGLVSVMANVWPVETNLYTKKAIHGEVQNLYPLWQKAADSLFLVSNPIPTKILLHQKGIISSPILRAPLTHLELVDPRPLLNADKEVTQWGQKENTL